MTTLSYRPDASESGGIAAPVLENALLPAHPNPFNPYTTIEFTLTAPVFVELKVFDIRGRLVQTLFAGIAKQGQNMIEWDGLDSKGSSVASGLYFARMLAKGEAYTQRLMLVR